VSRDNQIKEAAPRKLLSTSDVSLVPSDIAEYVQRTTKEQGVPEKVQDATAIGRLALMIKRPTRSSLKLDQTSKIAT
jgi:hypothetical protein